MEKYCHTKGINQLCARAAEIRIAGRTLYVPSAEICGRTADVASLRDYMVEGKTGFVCKPRDPIDLANCIETYFSSELHTTLEMRRREIQEFGNRRHSWAIAGEITRAVYRQSSGPE